MDKRYQVFVSSTYADLVDERRNVIQTLMQMDCIPAGMELFPAIDEEQWQFIKRIIDDCDYYIVIIGGRYGSTTPEGISYTEKEYNYAIEKGLKVLAFVHQRPDDIPVGKSDINHDFRVRLDAFRKTVTTDRLVKFWTSASELPGLVALSLSMTIKTYPAVGWVRADQVAEADILNKLNQFMERNKELEEQLARLTPLKTTVHDIAEMEEKIRLSGKHSLNNTTEPWNFTFTWTEVFAFIAPYLLEHPSDARVKQVLSEAVHQPAGRGYRPVLNDQDFQTVKVQLMALGLVDISFKQTTTDSMALFWALTTQGKAALIQLRTVKKAVTTSTRE